jgi:hypothetical protein
MSVYLARSVLGHERTGRSRFCHTAVDLAVQTRQLDGKFHRLVEPILGHERRKKLSVVINELFRLPNLGELLGLCQPASDFNVVAAPHWFPPSIGTITAGSRLIFAARISSALLYPTAVAAGSGPAATSFFRLESTLRFRRLSVRALRSGSSPFSIRQRTKRVPIGLSILPDEYWPFHYYLTFSPRVSMQRRAFVANAGLTAVPRASYYC